MIKRKLTIIFPNAHSRQYRLTNTTDNQIKSAEEFIDAVEFYKEELLAIRDVATSKYSDEDKGIYYVPIIIIRDLLQEDVYIHSCLDTLEDESGTQEFTLDLMAQDFTIYKTDGSLAGSMHLSMMFDNWKQIFYTTEEGAPKILTVEPRKMKEALKDISGAYELWEYAYVTQKIESSIVLEYSGAGDSGCTDVISNAHSDADDSFFRYFGEVYDKMDQLLWEIIQHSAEAGFYNNDGGFGRIEMGVDHFKWEHHNYVTETIQSQNEHITV